MDIQQTKTQSIFQGNNNVICPHCGRSLIIPDELILEKYVLHPYCGKMFRNPLIAHQACVVCPYSGEVASGNLLACPSRKSWMVVLFLCWFLGIFGIHSFYVGKTTNGILQLLTLGGLGFWVLIDFFHIICRKYRDGEGKLIVDK